MSHAAVRRSSRLALPLSAAALIGLTTQLATAEPTPDARRQEAQRCAQILKTSRIHFYLPACVDQAHGGYLESLRGGKFAPTGEKFLVMQGRQLWFFSTLAIEGLERESALAA